MYTADQLQFAVQIEPDVRRGVPSHRGRTNQRRKIVHGAPLRQPHCSNYEVTPAASGGIGHRDPVRRLSTTTAADRAAGDSPAYRRVRPAGHRQDPQVAGAVRRCCGRAQQWCRPRRRPHADGGLSRRHGPARCWICGQAFAPWYYPADLRPYRFDPTAWITGLEMLKAVARTLLSTSAVAAVGSSFRGSDPGPWDDLAFAR